MDLNRLSYNDICELYSLMGDIDYTIDKFRHVSNYLPKTLTDELKSFTQKIDNELLKFDN